MAQGLTARLVRLVGLAAVQLPALSGPDMVARGQALAGILQAMGGAYVKFGQFLATRHDLLDPAIIAALSGLFDRVSPAPFAAVRAAIETELGGPVSAHFAELEEQPIAAGAIAQVHGGRLPDGRPVAIKVRRPGIPALVATDIAILRAVGRTLGRAGLDDDGLVRSLVDEFATMLTGELDLQAEAEAMAAIGALLPAGARAPAVIGPGATPGLLVMERVEGTPFTRMTDCPAHVPDLLAEACLAQYFVHGRFHGDPHPGNLLLATDGTIMFLDFGLSGRLARADMDTMARYVLALSAGRFRLALRELSATLCHGPGADPAAFRRAAIPLLRRWRLAGMDANLPAAQRSVGQFQVQLMAEMRRTGVRVDSRFALYFRALGMLDATALTLPRPLDLPAVMLDFLQRRRRDIVLEGLPEAIPAAVPVELDFRPVAAVRPGSDTARPAKLVAGLAMCAVAALVVGAALNAGSLSAFKLGADGGAVRIERGDTGR